MKNHIHTIPVLDAFNKSKEQGGCPFCHMNERLNADAIDFIMGPAYMEDDVRMETNRSGFCAVHLEKMILNQNRLGLALMLHTHVQRINREISSSRVNIGEYMEKTSTSCYICERVENTFERYVDTFFRLWLGGGEEGRLIESVSGYCLPHFAFITHRAEKLGKSKAARFNENFAPAERQFFKTLEEDLEWFTLKFDYRNADAPWKNSKNVLPRAIKALCGGTQ